MSLITHYSRAAVSSRPAFLAAALSATAFVLVLARLRESLPREARGGPSLRRQTSRANWLASLMKRAIRARPAVTLTPRFRAFGQTDAFLSIARKKREGIRAMPHVVLRFGSLFRVVSRSPAAGMACALQSPATRLTIERFELSAGQKSM